MKTRRTYSAPFALFAGTILIGTSMAKDLSWCEFLQDSPGELYKSKKNPIVQKFVVGGRFHYQTAYLEGKDFNGRSFNDTYDEYRRFRIETKTDLFKYFEIEANVNLVDDRRFRDRPPTDLDWGYRNFDTLSVEFDIAKCLDLEALDKLDFIYGRMKLRVGEEQHQSSNEIYTIERSSVSEKISPDTGRPTGGLIRMEKSDWKLDMGVFSSEDDGTSIGHWNDGQFYYGSLAWEPNDFRFVYDHMVNDPNGSDAALQYAWVSSFSVIYDNKPWGILFNGIYGDNGGPGEDNIEARRQGRFWGGVVMPWYWIIKKKLQFVCSYEQLESQESQGIQTDSRYVGALHDNLLIDVDRGRGDRSEKFYAGFNYYFCGDNAKLMTGISHLDLSARKGDISATTYLSAVRFSF